MQVRAHAVSILERTSDEELLLYLLQLVQALRYEASDNSQLAHFIVSRAQKNATIGNFLHWYLWTEWEDPTFGSRAEKVWVL
jgi:phosphatidylinositol 3-kinase